MNCNSAALSDLTVAVSDDTVSSVVVLEAGLALKSGIESISAGIGLGLGVLVLSTLTGPLPRSIEVT